MKWFVTIPKNKSCFLYFRCIQIGGDTNTFSDLSTHAVKLFSSDPEQQLQGTMALRRALAAGTVVLSLFL